MSKRMNRVTTTCCRKAILTLNTASHDHCHHLKQFAIILGWQHHTRMKAYSMDLRRKVVDAVFSGRPKAQVARSFGVGISTVKRYASKAQKGESLVPKRPLGKRRKLDEAA